MARRIRRRRLVRFVSIALLGSLLALPNARAGVPTCLGEPATRIGTRGDDVLRGTAGDDVIVGLRGNDRLVGRGGNDVFCAGPGNDVVSGGGGDDTMAGQGGSDVLRGGPGNDTLLGGGGDDRLDGGDGADELDGGRGTDDCVLGETFAGCETGVDFAVDGSWAGATSQALGISFEIADQAITTITIAYSWSGPGCTSNGETTILFKNGHAIDGNEFTIDGGFGTFDLVINGTFTSDVAATGDFSASDSGSFCPGSASGTWDAAKG